MQSIKKILKIIGKIILVVVALALVILIYINIPVGKSDKKAGLGVTFSARAAADIGLDWKKAYLATLDDLQAKKIRLPIYWDLAEAKEGTYDFADIDWQLQEAAKRKVDIILAVGQKVPRWPECFTPEWAKNNNTKKNAAILKFIGVVVDRYKNNSTVKYWQVENEPFLPFGYCPDFDINNLDPEIAVVREKDPSRKIIVTDSGELSLWLKAAKRADIFGTTMYRQIWKEKVGTVYYPIGPRFFQIKKLLISLFAGQKNAIVVELQGEPWIGGPTTNSPLETQFSSMDAEKLKGNVEFAKKAGFSEIYIWGVEWWWWLKDKQNHPEVWDAAKELFSQNN